MRIPFVTRVPDDGSVDTGTITSVLDDLGITEEDLERFAEEERKGLPPKKSYKLFGARGLRFPYWFYEYLDPRNYWASLKHCRQRLVRGYSDRDLWNLDNHLAEILHDALPFFRSDGASHTLPPVGDFDWWWQRGGMTEEDHEAAVAMWDGIVDEMVEGFRILAYVSPVFRTEEQRAKAERAKSLLAEYFEALWD